MLVGYARIPTVEQTLALQQGALTKAGCQRTSTDTASGSRTERPGLAEALAFARPGDTLVICGWTGSAARCATSSTPSPCWPSAASA